MKQIIREMQSTTNNNKKTKGCTRTNCLPTVRTNEVQLDQGYVLLVFKDYLPRPPAELKHFPFYFQVPRWTAGRTTANGLLVRAGCRCGFLSVRFSLFGYFRFPATYENKSTATLFISRPELNPNLTRTPG
ncbi:uncharacterized protein LOC119610346 isoform X1 [Lucilia sericata]|uniref:uncharacterized protein LOC119610346 isoform X1 n=1 Tax=Lucilia sericata TaxID=13632 RepID=UPI0018A856E2|nr:uncharacterized protein LOC119610346 isoform X1 [Lucilia sericata]XP_037821448.1 uncharacterized protein LOC119610346 isoform X1 [Lucilia sericata]